MSTGDCGARTPSLHRPAEGPTRSRRLRYVSSLAATTNAVWLVEEVFSVSRRRFGILVDGNHDRLDVLIAPAFSCQLAPRFIKRLQNRRWAGLIDEPSCGHRSDPRQKATPRRFCPHLWRRDLRNPGSRYRSKVFPESFIDDRQWDGAP